MSGQLTSLPLGTKVAVSVAVSQDAEKLGVGWSASCGGSALNPPAANPCGTIAPAFTGSTLSITYTAPLYIPVGTNVTLTAQATSDPSITSSITLPITPLPIQIAFTTPPPAQLGMGASVILSATVTNDLIAAGVNWKATCATSSCGTFQSGLPNPNQTASAGRITYTAPANPAAGTIVITAASVADPTKSVTASTVVAPVSITIAPATATVPLLTQASLVASVAFDTANKGVDWAAPVCASPGACGSLSLTHTASGVANVYTPPAAIPMGGVVTITAASTTSPATSASAVLTIVPPPPIAVSVAPAAASAQITGTAALVATVLNDSSARGADWTLACGSPVCGVITAHTASGAAALYVAPAVIPAGGTVTATAKATSDPTKTGTSTVTIVPAISIAFSPPTPASVTAGVAASFTATVTNDLAAAGVDWTATCASGACGTFSSGNAAAPSHTASGAPVSFTAPADAVAGTVKIIATSTASTTALPVRSVSTTVTVIPVISVSFVPYAPTQIQVSDSTLVAPPPTRLVAVTRNDATNGGLDWSCTPVATCGQFQRTPAQPATATTPAANPTYGATVHTANGQAALYVPPSTATAATVTAKAHNPAATSPLATVAASIAIVTTPSGVTLQGTVLAGNVPVAGSQVYLYAAGTSGYSSTATPLAVSGSATSVPTAASGVFTIPAGYSCPLQSSQMYLVAVGGNAGAGVNPNLSLMTALGPCSGLSSAVGLIVNEVTTVASVWPLAPFMADYGHVGSSAANATNGLANAFATVNNLVNVTTGVARSTPAAGNGSVPLAEIDTLANILNTCTATAGGTIGDGSKCSALFTATDLNGIPANAPQNTVQAALDIALTPAYGTNPGPGNLYQLVSAAGPFTPILTTAPSDWSVSLSFSGGGLEPRSFAAALAIDAAGDLWVANSNQDSVTEFNASGAALSPAGTGTGTATVGGGFAGAGISSPDALAIDQLGNAWVASTGTVSELPATLQYTYTAPLAGSGFTGGGLADTINGIAIDGVGNVWAINSDSPGALAWLAGANTTLNGTATAAGTPLSPSTGFTRGVNMPSGAIGVDTAGTVWLLNTGDNSAAEYTSANGAFLQTDYGYAQTVPGPSSSVLSVGVSSQLAIDNPGNIYLPANGELLELTAGGSAATYGGTGAASTSQGLVYSPFLALDGARHVWLLITGGNANCPSPTSLLELNASGIALNQSSSTCGYVGAGIGAGSTGIAIDGSGSAWVLNSGTLTQFVGVAAPVVTPLAAGVTAKTLGNRP